MKPPKKLTLKERFFQFMKRAPSPKRHHWIKVGSEHKKTMTCIDCGCIKDTYSYSYTQYNMDGVITNYAPLCISKQNEIR